MVAGVGMIDPGSDSQNWFRRMGSSPFGSKMTALSKVGWSPGGSLPCLQKEAHECMKLLKVLSSETTL